ncbi:MAG: VTT domain-containing protein [Clostridia bacterium]
MEKVKIEKKNKIKFLVLIIFALLIGALAIRYGAWITQNLKEPDKVRGYLLSFGNLGAVIYILVQALHVLIVVIPGDIFNICGGYIYGVPLGFSLSITGIMLGTVGAFYISRFLGYDFIAQIIPEEKIRKISNILNSTQGTVAMLIICLIPIIPKDLMIYIAGLTPIKASKLFFIYAISRIPGTLIWVSVGANIYEKNITGIILTVCGLALLLLACFLLQKKTNIVEK